MCLDPRMSAHWPKIRFCITLSGGRERERGSAADLVDVGSWKEKEEVVVVVSWMAGDGHALYGTKNHRSRFYSRVVCMSEWIDHT